MTAPRLHCWVPDVTSAKGGIQEFSNRLIEAAGACLPPAEIAVFAKNDRGNGRVLSGSGAIRVQGCGRWPKRLRTLAFGARIMAEALLRPPQGILMTHLHFAPAARWVQRGRRVPYAVVAHGIDAWGLVNPRVVAGLRSAHRILAVSRFTREVLLRELSLDPARVALLPNTVNAERFRPGPKPAYLLERLGLTADQPVILTVCRLPSVERYKGYDQILRALPAIRQRIPQVRYILGGAGPDLVRVRAIVQELGLQDAVLLPGFIPDAELCDYYNLCDVFAMPSKAEGFGIVFLEALACGKPVLTGNRDGSVDAVLDGEVGCLVDPDSVPEIAASLIALLDRSHSQRVLFQPDELRRRILAAYGFDRFTETVRGHLSDLLSAR